LGVAARPGPLPCLQQVHQVAQGPLLRPVSKDCWPPSSPDLNPLDYFVWGYLGTHTNRRGHTTKASLINSIKENFASMDKAIVAKTCVAFRGRGEAVIEAETAFLSKM
jgi:hypothetical protein